MYYIDPFDFLKFEAQSEEEYSAPLVAVAARNLLLKYDHSKDDQLAYEGKSVSRADAEALIESFKNPEIRAFHFRIKSNNPLHQFLAKQDGSQIKKIGAQIISKDEAFNDFCSPFLASTYSSILISAVQNRHWLIVKGVYSQLFLLRPNDFSQALKPVLSYLENEVRTMEGALKLPKSQAKLKAQIAMTIGERANSDLLNGLPEDYQALRSIFADLLGQMAHFVYTIARDHQRSLKIVQIACAIKVEPEIERKLNDLHTLIEKKHNEKFGDPVEKELVRQENSRNTIGIVVAAVLIFTTTVIRGCIVANRSRHSELEYIPSSSQMDEVRHASSVFEINRGKKGDFADY